MAEQTEAPQAGASQEAGNGPAAESQPEPAPAAEVAHGPEAGRPSGGGKRSARRSSTGTAAKKATASRKKGGSGSSAPATGGKPTGKRPAGAKTPAAKAPGASTPGRRVPTARAGSASERTAEEADGSQSGARRISLGSITPRLVTSGRKRAAAKRTVARVRATADDIADRAESARERAGAVVGTATGNRPPSDDPTVVAPKRLSGFDFATWRSAAHDPAMRSPIIGLVALDSSPDWDRLVERFDRASRVAPILRQKVLEGPADILSPRLVIDPDFDLSFHIRRFRVADPGSWEQVLDETRRQSMTDFDTARPLWRVTLLEGLQGGRAALIVKLHHAIADGQGAMMLGATVIDLTAADQDLGPMPAAPRAAQLDTAGFLGNVVADASSFLVRSAKEAKDAALPLASRAVRDPLGLAEDLLSVVRSVSKFVSVPSRPMSPVMTGRSINYHFATFDVPLDELKVAAKQHGLSLNDAFMAGVTGGLRIYHERRDEPVHMLRCNMPISLRDPERPAQNAVTIARFEVPVGVADVPARMAAIHEIVAGWRQEPALHLVDPLAEVGSRIMPPDMVAAAAQRSDFTASNVPGVPIPVYVGGAKVLAMYPMTATIGAATNVTLLSYAGVAGLGISMDDAAIPDRELFIECMGLGFAEVVGHPVVPSDPIGG